MAVSKTSVKTTHTTWRQISEDSEHLCFPLAPVRQLSSTELSSYIWLTVPLVLEPGLLSLTCCTVSVRLIPQFKLMHMGNSTKALR
jgi:hypothetical protein